MAMTLHRLCLIGALSLLSVACANQPMVKESSYTPARPVMAPLIPPTAGAIYAENQGLILFEDSKAHRVGDILTVILQEKTDASSKASTNTSKSSEIDMPNPTLLGGSPAFRLPQALTNNNRWLTLENNVNADNKFSGSGDSTQSNSLNGSVTVTITEVLPNGNFVVQGEKLYTINRGSEFVRFSGIVRPVDVRPDNTVPSYMVADAQITYAGKGVVADANTMGWLGRFFNSKWWPF